LPFKPESRPIAIGMALERLFFLHSGAWIRGKEPVGEYLVSYADGSTLSIPLTPGDNLTTGGERPRRRCATTSVRGVRPLPEMWSGLSFCLAESPGRSRLWSALPRQFRQRHDRPIGLSQMLRPHRGGAKHDCAELGPLCMALAGLFLGLRAPCGRLSQRGHQCHQGRFWRIGPLPFGAARVVTIAPCRSRLGPDATAMSD
jgi:hypothetical protein